MLVETPGMAGDPLGRFYTDPDVSRYLVSLFERGDAAEILDLGAGTGSLSVAAARRWSEARILTVDKDCEAGARIRGEMSIVGHRSHTHLEADAFDENLPDLVSGSRFDLAVCNPPYIKARWRKGFDRILSDGGLSDLHAATSGILTSELVFIAQTLRLARKGADIGLIVPDGLVTGRRSRAVREALMRRARIVRAVQLPRGVFQGTEAQAHVLVLRNEPGRGGDVEVSRLTGAGTTRPIRIAAADAVQRLDYAFYEPQEPLKQAFTLRRIGAVITRGAISSREARCLNTPVFHTSDFAATMVDARRLASGDPGVDRAGCRIAEPGDILVARVDRNLHRKVCLVCDGRAALTDCVYRVRVPPLWRHAVLSALTAPAGQAALLRASRGVGPRMLGKEDLLDLELRAA